MSNSYKGKIVAIEGIQSIQRQGKEPFEKRRLMLDATRFDGLTGERGYEKRIIFDFSGKNVHVPDGFNVGDIVTENGNDRTVLSISASILQLSNTDFSGS